MAVFTYVPDRGYTRSTTPRVMVAQMGDGYAQRVQDGINNVVSQWNLSFTGRSLEESAAIVALLESSGGFTPLDWTPPQELVAVKVIASQWNSTYQSNISRNTTVTFTQVFDL